MTAHVVRTTHIRAMLADALRLAHLAEEEMDGSAEQMRALQAAAVQARHAAAELDDEHVRVLYPGAIGT